MPLQDATKTADLLGVTVQRLYDLVKHGVVPSVRVGRRVMFDPDAIRDWIKAGGQSLPGGWRREPLANE